ncbi:MAG: hypothetical protein WD431_18870 [Cyclobacteriaceae bacterium]
MEKHLSKRTKELFDLEDKVILYDLTNTYFEGEKRNSQLAKFGRSKEKKEEGMKLQFEKRFEQELQKIHTALHSKGGVKKADKVHRRIGRAKQKYPSVQQYYDITVGSDAKTGLATEINWEKDGNKHREKNESLGIYFLRANLDVHCPPIILSVFTTTCKPNTSHLPNENP